VKSILLLSKKYNYLRLLAVGFIILTLIFLISVGNLNTLLATAAITDEKGYDLKEVKDDVYVISSNGYNVMFLVTGEGVVIIDAPPAIGDKIPTAISEVTNETIKHLIYSHSHKDHIGAAHIFQQQPDIEIVAQNETANILKMRNDPQRPIPTTTFVDNTTLTIGNKTIQLTYPGPYHQRGNIFVYVPEQKVLMAVDQLAPGEVPWKHLASTPEVPALIRSYDQALAYDFDVYVPGHGETGTKEDIKIQQEYVNDLKNNSQFALTNVNYTEATKNIDKQNNAATTEAYFNALTDICVDRMDNKWKGKLNGVGVWTDEHCEKMIQSLRVD
jgi:glyoxylase-like metal-dependent hydrolase (beta-lactamase superfamily II)